MKYRDNMSAEETAKLLAEIKTLDDCYQSLPGVKNVKEDEMEILKKAALNRGRP